MKRIDISQLEPVTGSGYPPSFDEPCRRRGRRRLGDAAGLSQFGVNLLRLPPGAWSSQRHWHTGEDEFVYVLKGEVVLFTDEGEDVLQAGEAAGFKAGEANGHHLENRSSADALVLEIGTPRVDDTGDYSDVDMVCRSDGKFARRDGTLY